MAAAAVRADSPSSYFFTIQLHDSRSRLIANKIKKTEFDYTFIMSAQFWYIFTAVGVSNRFKNKDFNTQSILIRTPS